MKTVKPSKILEINVQKTIPRVFVLFLQTAHAIEKYGEKELYLKEGLSLPKFIVLGILEANGGTMMPSRIARLMLREKHDITAFVDRLSRDGLVRVERGIFTDRREVHIILTDKGRQVVKRARPVFQKVTDKIMAGIDENSAASLEQLLKALRLHAVEGLDFINKDKHAT